MASAKQRKAKFISNKLKFLKDQGDHLISAVGQYVNRIIAAGESWTQGGDSNVEFEELCHMTDAGALFLCEKCEELADLTSQSITDAASTPATSDRQPTAQLASTATTSYRKPAAPVAFTPATSHTQSTETVQPAGETQLQKMSTAQNRQKEGIESQAELVEKLVHEPNLLESMKENVDALDDRSGGSIDDCRNKHEDIETVTRDLVDKVMANTHSVQVLSEGQDKMTTLMKELETRLQIMEEGSGRNLKDVSKHVKKGESDVSQLFQEVAVMSPRLQQLEVKPSGTRCGFTASSWILDVADNTIIRQYDIMNCNVNENFNADSGIFTAPVDGLYVAAISLWLWENEHVSVGVQYKQCLDQESSTLICLCSAVTKYTTACRVSVVEMKAGEVLYCRLYQIQKNDYHKRVYFSCFLLG